MDWKKIEIDGDSIYLKKGMFGWNVIEPWKDDNGKVIWFNFIFGGWKTLGWMIFIIALLGLFYLTWHETAFQLERCLNASNVIDAPSNIINWTLG